MHSGTICDRKQQMFTEKDVRVKKRVEQTSVILLKDKL
jgi:hypothetical protein